TRLCDCPSVCLFYFIYSDVMEVKLSCAQSFRCQDATIVAGLNVLMGEGCTILTYILRICIHCFFFTASNHMNLH
ncbi:Hypothetical predicted protein, partial [Mytilus galloprovincialis]